METKATIKTLAVKNIELIILKAKTLSFKDFFYLRVRYISVEPKWDAQ